MRTVVRSGCLGGGSTLSHTSPDGSNTASSEGLADGRNVGERKVLAVVKVVDPLPAQKNLTLALLPSLVPSTLLVLPRPRPLPPSCFNQQGRARISGASSSITSPHHPQTLHNRYLDPQLAITEFSSMEAQILGA